MSRREAMGRTTSQTKFQMMVAQLAQFAKKRGYQYRLNDEVSLPAQIPDGLACGPLQVRSARVKDASKVLPTIARHLGLDERDNRWPREQLAAALRSRNLLLLPDNFEHLLAAREDVRALLADCPQLVVLITSRLALRYVASMSTGSRP